MSDFKFQKGLNAYTPGFDIGKCVVSRFEMTVQYKDGRTDPVSIANLDQKFSKETTALMETVKKGDTVYFDNITCKCPGDKASRKINAMIFRIK